MTEKSKEPIDLLKRRVEKLLEQERQEKEVEETRQQEWSGERFATELAKIELSEDLLKGVRTFICAIARKVKEAESIDDVKRTCYGLALLLLRDYDRPAFDKLLVMMKEEVEKT
jgi:hypothetical protein